MTSLRRLRTGRAGAPRGQARQAVALIHGYGADGADLLGLAEVLGPHLPGTVFLAPDAPEPCTINPAGRQWFAIPRMDGSSAAQAEAGLRAAAADLDGWIDATLTDEGLAPDRLILLGFSQGSMLSLHVAPRRPVPVAGVVAFSGRLLHPEEMPAALRSRPPVLLAHGDVDDIVPFADMSAAETALRGAGFDVASHVMRGTGHGISPDGLGRALTFMRAVLDDSAG